MKDNSVELREKIKKLISFLKDEKIEIQSQSYALDDSGLNDWIEIHPVTTGKNSEVRVEFRDGFLSGKTKEDDYDIV